MLLCFNNSLAMADIGNNLAMGYVKSSAFPYLVQLQLGTVITREDPILDGAVEHPELSCFAMATGKAA
jgi:hypothetical protein